MGYLQTTDQGSIHEAINLGAAQKSERSASLTALGRSPQRTNVRGLEHIDRVTLSPAADALSQVSPLQGPASTERLDVLREAIKANSMPIYPKAVAEAILREEGHGSIGATGQDDSLAQSE